MTIEGSDLAEPSLPMGGEGQTCEFKESLLSGAQDEAIRSLVAFANTTRGICLFRNSRQRKRCRGHARQTDARRPRQSDHTTDVPASADGDRCPDD